MRTAAFVLIGVLVVCFASAPTTLASDINMGKVYIQAGTGTEMFPDLKLADSVKDLQHAATRFTVVSNIHDADYLLVVVSRDEVASAGGRSGKTLVVTVSSRAGDTWKPEFKLSKGSTIWSVCASRVMDEFATWVKRRNAS